MQVSGMRDQLADDAASKIVLRYIPQSLEQIYQRALKQFKNHGLKSLGSYPADTAALEGLTLDNIMGDWWPESVRYGACCTVELDAGVSEPRSIQAAAQACHAALAGTKGLLANAQCCAFEHAIGRAHQQNS